MKWVVGWRSLRHVTTVLTVQPVVPGRKSSLDRAGFVQMFRQSTKEQELFKLRFVVRNESLFPVVVRYYRWIVYTIAIWL